MALSQKEADVQMMLAAQCHLGTKNCDFQMERYTYKRRNDGAWNDGACRGRRGTAKGGATVLVEDEGRAKERCDRRPCSSNGRRAPGKKRGWKPLGGEEPTPTTHDAVIQARTTDADRSANVRFDRRRNACL